MNCDGYKIRDQYGIHFITFATVKWVYVFHQSCYADIFLDSMRYCIREKGLRLHAWCLMGTHVHMIVSAEHGNLSAVLRDLKKFTSVKLLQAIRENPAEPDKDRMLAIFREAGEKCSRNKTYQFWQHDNHPEHIYSEKFINQKVRYIHQNPVKAGMVKRAGDYALSSAGDYEGREGLLVLLRLKT